MLNTTKVLSLLITFLFVSGCSDRIIYETDLINQDDVLHDQIDRFLENSKSLSISKCEEKNNKYKQLSSGSFNGKCVFVGMWVNGKFIRMTGSSNKCK